HTGEINPPPVLKVGFDIPQEIDLLEGRPETPGRLLEPVVGSAVSLAKDPQAHQPDNLRRSIYVGVVPVRGILIFGQVHFHAVEKRLNQSQINAVGIDDFLKGVKDRIQADAVPDRTVGVEFKLLKQL